MIFENEKKLLGEQEYSSTDYSLIPLLREAVSIRKKLGRKGYLLDAYLSTFLEAVTPLSDYEVCEEGFSDATEFRSLCRKAVGQRPTDSVVREVYDENGWISSFQESSTRTELLQALCLDRKLSVFVCNFMDKWKNRIGGELDVPAFQTLYQRIAGETGEDVMEKFNLHLKQRFMIAPCLSMFLQGMTCDLLLALITEDLETNRKVFQILMDHLEEDK